jgi:hypothetical protein
MNETLCVGWHGCIDSLTRYNLISQFALFKVKTSGIPKLDGTNAIPFAQATAI